MMVVMVMVKWGFVLLSGNEGLQKPIVYPLSWIFKYCLQLLSSVQILSQTMDIPMSVLLIFYVGDTSCTLSPQAMMIKKILFPLPHFSPGTMFLGLKTIALCTNTCVSVPAYSPSIKLYVIIYILCLVKMPSWKSLGDRHSYWLFYDMRKVAVSISRWIIGVRVEISRWMRTLQLRTFT